MSKSDSASLRDSIWVMWFLIKIVVRVKTCIPDPRILIIHRRVDKSIKSSPF
jgi:hypothetical protein